MSSFKETINLDSKNDNYIKPFNYTGGNRNESNTLEIEKYRKISLYSINIDTIEGILMKYIINNKIYINNIIDVKIISNYLYNSRKLKSFINLNEITLNDFISIVLGSKIILCQNGNCIYKQGDDYLGFYTLLKGNIKVKVSKLNCLLGINKDYKEEILKEYNLDMSEVNWTSNNNTLNKSNDYRNNSIHFHNNDISSIFSSNYNFKSKRNSLRNSLLSYSRKSIININNEYSTEKDLFFYTSKNNLFLNNESNETLIFGGINLFNEYMIDNPQIHLSSVYSYSKNEVNITNKINNKYKKVNYDTILLFFREESLKEIRKKVTEQNKARIKFLNKKLIPMTKMSYFDCSSIISHIKLIYIHVNEKKAIQINNNIFFLIYKGECYIDDIKKNVIYSEGDFLFLNNIFGNNIDKKMVSFHSKSSNTTIFQINLGILSNSNLIIMKKFLKNIYEGQLNIRIDYHINKINYNLNAKNNKEKEKDGHQYYIVYKKVIQSPIKYKKINNKKIIRLKPSNNPYDTNNKRINSLIICYYNNDSKNNIFNKNNSCSNTVKFKRTKINNMKILRPNTPIKKYSSKINNLIKQKHINNNYSSIKNNISTKYSTNSYNNISSNILNNNSTKISRFNENESKMKSLKIENKKYKKIISNFGLKTNIISSIIPRKIKNNNYYEFNECSNDIQNNNNKLITKNYFHKKIFLNNISKFIYQKNYLERNYNKSL